MTVGIRGKQIQKNYPKNQERCNHAEYHKGGLIGRLQARSNRQVNDDGDCKKQHDTNDHQQRAQQQIGDLVGSTVDIGLVHAGKLTATPARKKCHGKNTEDDPCRNVDKGNRNPPQAPVFPFCLERREHRFVNDGNFLQDVLEDVTR